MNIKSNTKSGLQIIFCDLKRWKPEHPKYGISYASTDVISGNNKAKLKKVFNALIRSNAMSIGEMREIATSTINESENDTTRI